MHELRKFTLGDLVHSFFVRGRQESVLRVPTQMPDKFVKEQCQASLFLSWARGAYYASRFRVKRLFSLFSVRFWSEPR